MSRILILAESPRKNGNTDRLAASFIRGALGHNEIEVVSVCDYKVDPSTGCNSCFSRVKNECFQSDDMEKLYDKLCHTDIVIIASPVYFCGLSSQMKAVLDRFNKTMHNLTIKKLGLLLAGAARIPELFDTILGQYNLIINSFQLEDAGQVLARSVKNKDEISETDLKKAYELGRAI